MEALDYGSQALAADPGHSGAAALVGVARRRLGALSEASAELRRITVVAVDMYRSTAIAAQVGPEAMRELMLEVYEVCVDAVARYEGRVTKYTGDGILALFGYPVAHEDDARRAVLASLAVLEAVDARAAGWEARVGAAVTFRIGVDSGVVAVGPVDSSPWSSEEIAGDPPNVASRVQTTAEQMTVRVTDATHALIAGWFETEPVGPVELRNYPEPIGLHRVVAPTPAETRLEARAGVRPPLLGRDAELTALRSLWSGVAASGERRVARITGEPGIGKSRLVEHLTATAIASGGAHVTFACARLHGDSALRPVTRACARFFSLSPRERGHDALTLDAIRRQLDQLGHRRVATEDAVPILGWLLGVRSAVDLEPEDLRRQTFDVVIDLLEAIAAGSQLLLCVDDADTADPSTVELLRALLARPPTPMLVVLTGRSGRPELDGPVDVLELTGLGADDATALVRAVAPAIGDDVATRLVAGSDGVPYFLEEQARAAIEAPDGAAPAPLELSVFLAARLDELGAVPKRLLGEIAVAGESVQLEVLTAVTELPVTELQMRLDELGRRRVLVRAAGRAGEVVRFRHALMREVALDGLLASRRADLHRRYAEALSARPGLGAPEDLARHLEEAGDAEPAARAWLEAGRAAAEGGANAEASTLLRRSIEVLSAVPEGAARDAVELEAQLAVGTVLSALEGYASPNARAAFERAVVLGERLGDTATVFPALWGTSSYWFVLGEHRRDAGVVERIVRIADLQADPRFRFEAAFVAGYRALHLGRFATAREELDRATRHLGLEPIADLTSDTGIVSRSTLSVVMWFLGEAEASRRMAGEALVLADALDPAGRRAALTACWVHANLAWRAVLDEDPAAAIALAERSAAVAGVRHYPTWLAAAVLHRSIALCRLGQLDEGLPTLAAMVEAWRGAGRDPTGRQQHPMLMTPYFAGRLAEALLASGDAAEAARLAGELLDGTERSGERFWDVELLRLRAAARRELGAPAEQVAADADAAAALAAEQGASALARDPAVEGGLR